MSRPGGARDVAGRVTKDRRLGRCLGCGQPHVPRVAEDVCPTCVASILADPDLWLGRLEVPP